MMATPNTGINTDPGPSWLLPILKCRYNITTDLKLGLLI